MTAELIDGKKLAAEVRARLKNEIAADKSENLPLLAVVMVGENDASRIYVRNKQKAAAEIGMGCEVYEFAESVGERALMSSLEDLNENPHINGIIVQQPLPEHIDPLKILGVIDPAKDVDGFSPTNLGLLATKEPQAIVAATPKGVLQLLQSTGQELAGKHAVIIGRSNIVGRPLAMLLLNQDCTVTVCHTKTRNLAAIVRQADIVVAACGCARLVKADWIKDGATVIDVGINRVDGKLCGDVDFDGVKEKAAYLTPVPGGVGPMTVAMLLENTWEAAQRQTDETAPAGTAGHGHHCHCTDKATAKGTAGHSHHCSCGHCHS